MPKPSNQRVSIGERLTRRANQVNPKRIQLLERLLEESSSISLNDTSNLISPKQALDAHSELLDLISEINELETPLNKKLPERSDENWTRFFEWVEQELYNDVEYRGLASKLGVSPRVATGDGLDYGLVAKVPFMKDESIFNIHRKLMLSTETISRDIDLHEFVKRDSIASGMQNVVLVLHVLNEYSKGEKSHWYNYLSILPSKILPILCLDKSKFKHLIASAHIYDALKMVRAISRQYSYFYKRLQNINLPLSRDLTFKYYCWGVSIVCSRQNEIPSLRQAGLSPITHALIPILDMCNHDRLSYQATFENSKSCLRAHKYLKPGDEITINYGTRSSGDFYIHNGFIPDVVPYDIVPFTSGITKQDKLYTTKVELLKTLNMPHFGRFKLTFNNYENRHKRDPHLTMFLIVFSLTEEEVDFIMDNANPVGIADEIYEYVQYGQVSNQSIPEETPEVTSAFGSEVVLMKTRLDRAIKDYMSKRCAISVAMIDRELTSLVGNDPDLAKLLSNEKLIYESHITGCNKIC